jgi:hypothetical protein
MPQAVSVRPDTACFSTNISVAQLVEALHYNPEGRGFDFRFSQWDFLLI